MLFHGSLHGVTFSQISLISQLFCLPADLSQKRPAWSRWAALRRTSTHPVSTSPPYGGPNGAQTQWGDRAQMGHKAVPWSLHQNTHFVEEADLSLGIFDANPGWGEIGISTHHHFHPTIPIKHHPKRGRRTAARLAQGMQGQDNLSLVFLLASAPPHTLNFNGAHRKRKTLVAPEINISLDQSEGSILSDDFLDTPDDLDINVDDIETPDETDSLEFLGNGNELEWEGMRMALGELVEVASFPPLLAVRDGAFRAHRWQPDHSLG